MSPIAFLVVFCATMTAIALVRFWRSAPLTRREATAGVCISFGLTVLSTLWFAIDDGWLGTTTRLVLAGVGVTFVLAGMVVVVRALEGEFTANDGQ